MLEIAIILALFWGGIWAIFLQHTHLGQFLAIKRTWVTVVVGIGVDLLIMLLVVPWDIWLKIVTIITASSILIIARSLVNEYGEIVEEIYAIKNTPGEQDDLGAGRHPGDLH